MEEEIKQLEERIAYLEKMLDLASFPLEIQQVMNERMGLINAVRVGAYTQSGVERNINLSGASETITVLAYPDEFIRVRYKGGKVKYIPSYNDLTLT